MPTRFQTFARRFVFAANFAIAIAFLLSCIAPYLNPVKWWFISWLGLIFPLLFIVLLFSFFFWLFFRRKYALIIFVVLVFGLRNLVVSFGFHIPHKFNYEKKKNELRIVSWNVARFIEIKKNSNKGSQTRLKMMELLKQQNADVLCLQEFHSANTAVRPDYYDNISYIKEQLNYPYYYFSYDEDGEKLFYSSIIFSRFPIIDSGILIYPRPTLPEALVHADIIFNHDTIRIFTTHLQSVQFRKKDYERIDEIKTYQDSLIDNSKTILSKIRRGISYRSIQANIVRKNLDESPYPSVLCADFNDVPTSYTYFKIRGNWKDGFLKKRFGIGRTFSSISPTLRIDYILTSKEFSVQQFNRLVKNYSDHYMLVSDLKLEK
jgi:endonuclease/exonuclease/phosphatase family metal-dependent hydrolase